MGNNAEFEYVDVKVDINGRIETMFIKSLIYFVFIYFNDYIKKV